MIASIVLPLPVDTRFSYTVPLALQDEVRPGSRVLVPFGPRRMTGMVVGEGEEMEGLKPILDVLDDEPAFTDEMLRLTRWIADYYACGWGEVVRAALPSGTEIETRHRVIRTEAAAGSDLNPRAAAVLRYLERHPETTVTALRQQVKGTTLALVRRLEREGLVRLESETAAPRVRVRYEKHVRFAPAYRSRRAASELVGELRGARQIALVEALDELAVEGLACPRQTELLERVGASAASLRSLVDKGIVEIVEKEMLRSPVGALSAEVPATPQHALHPAQLAALKKLADPIDRRDFQAFLLHGVTGSGKTEVYIAALKRVLEQGRTGIILVPEIALTPQTVQRFRAHFGDQIAVLHSRMSLGERYDAWRHLRSGRFPIVIGPRSAVLAPLSNIGLIVVDEEHEQSYKQFDPAPRYHARDVAVMRAHLNDAVCVLGSATPSLESYMNVQWGKYELLEMRERVPVAGRLAQLPAIRLVDLTLEKKKHRLKGALSDELLNAIGERLERGEQAILLQNRRGYAPIVECESCGWTPECSDCAVTLTYHKASRRMRCHYCGRTERLPSTCPSCGADDIAPLGAGTQRVEEELAAAFPDARILRMDLDTTSRKNAHHRLLDRFGRGEADILLGTQMVAKGLDFGRVTLVGVVNADVGMLLPDFRSEERTFQLLTQVAGRSGRAELAGEVVIQTRNPDRPVIHYALEHDYDGFAQTAIEDRRQLSYPPFGRMVGVEFRGPEERRVREVAERWTRILTQQQADVVILGPEPAFISRVKRQYRFHTIIKVGRGANSADLQALLRRTSEAYGTPPKDYRIAVDVDPVGLF